MSELFTGYHNCSKPPVMECPPDVEEFTYRWRCRECRSIWGVTVKPKSVWDFGLTSPVWRRVKNPSWLWKRKRSKELTASQGGHELERERARREAERKLKPPVPSDDSGKIKPQRRTRGGYPSSPTPYTELPRVPAGPAPGATPPSVSRSKYISDPDEPAAPPEAIEHHETNRTSSDYIKFDARGAVE